MFYRRGSGLPQRTLGSLYWQLEDQWAAPTWVGIEMSGPWKVLHYRAKDAHQNLAVAAFGNETTGNIEIWVTSDLWEVVNRGGEPKLVHMERHRLKWAARIGRYSSNYRSVE